jgi:predicted short-subunit dehydrogenase-like oxidoreductase (DUF2520 family)
LKQSRRLFIFEEKMESLRCVIIGAGNLASQLGVELFRNGVRIDQVYSRTESSAKSLAEKTEAGYTSRTEEIIGDADVYFIVLKDSAFSEVLPKIAFGDKLVIHCSGSLPIEVLESYSANFAVLYPLQTFSKNRAVNFSEIPVFIEANNERNLQVISRIAQKLSNIVKIATSEERLHLHIAAVFACNFANHMYSVAESILEKNGISFEVLKPLINETTKKISTMTPFNAQTGPAVRFDQNIISKHLEVLGNDTTLADLYKTISKSIFELHQKQE